MIGWTCPGCGRCYAPSMPMCCHCPGGGTVVANSIITGCSSCGHALDTGFLEACFCPSYCLCRQKGYACENKFQPPHIPMQVPKTSPIQVSETRKIRNDSPIYCEHANECPNPCPCPPSCWCRQPGRMCENRPHKYQTDQDYISDDISDYMLARNPNKR